MKTKKKNRITLVLGGARSGKSSYAGRLAEKTFRHPLFIATAEPSDSEMEARIERHKTSRSSRWACVEQPLDIAKTLLNIPAGMDGVLLDCVTVWLSNVLIKEGRKSIGKRQAELVSALGRAKRDVIVVSNEVGMGIVPDTEMGREFRDFAGWLNQALAEIADVVVFVVAGIPMTLKEKKERR